MRFLMLGNRITFAQIIISRTNCARQISLMLLILIIICAGCGSHESVQEGESETTTESFSTIEETVENVESLIIDTLRTGNVSDAVDLYNDSSNELNESSVVSEAFSDYMDKMALSFYSEDISYIEAGDVLKKIQNIKNTSISAAATDILNSITNEYNGTNLHVKAEKYYSVGQYAEAMKEISEIPESYSQYDSAENLYGLCKQIIIAKADDIVSC